MYRGKGWPLRRGDSGSGGGFSGDFSGRQGGDGLRGS